MGEEHEILHDTHTFFWRHGTIASTRSPCGTETFIGNLGLEPLAQSQIAETRGSRAIDQGVLEIYGTFGVDGYNSTVYLRVCDLYTHVTEKNDVYGQFPHQSEILLHCYCAVLHEKGSGKDLVKTFSRQCVQGGTFLQHNRVRLHQNFVAPHNSRRNTDLWRKLTQFFICITITVIKENTEIIADCQNICYTDIQSV